MPVVVTAWPHGTPRERPQTGRQGQIDYAASCHSDKRGNHEEGRLMINGNSEKDLGEKANRPSSVQFFEQMISYNVDEAERPGGLKVRFKITVVTGKRAAALDARQAEAIRRLLEWTLQYKQETGSR